LLSKENAGQRGIVGLSAARSEYDFADLATDQFRDLIPGALDRIARSQSRPMAAGGIAEFASQKRLHRADNLRRQRSGGVMVEVNAHDGDHAHGSIRR